MSHQLAQIKFTTVPGGCFQPDAVQVIDCDGLDITSRLRIKSIGLRLEAGQQLALATMTFLVDGWNVTNLTTASNSARVYADDGYELLLGLAVTDLKMLYPQDRMVLLEVEFAAQWLTDAPVVEMGVNDEEGD